MRSTEKWRICLDHQYLCQKFELSSFNKHALITHVQIFYLKRFELTSLYQMAAELNFDQIKNIIQPTKDTVHGYIRDCEKLFPSDNPYYHIPKLINFLVLLFYNDIECFAVDGNNSQIFNYIFSKHKNYYHIFGVNRICRKSVLEYKWIIETSKTFQGRFGIINDIPVAYKQIPTQECYWKNQHIINVGSNKLRHCGHNFGNIHDKDLHDFFQEEEIVVITINFTKNTITFKAKTQGKEVLRYLKPGIDAVKFCAEIKATNSFIRFLRQE